MKRSATAALAALAALLLFANPAQARNCPQSVGAQAAIVIEVSTGIVACERQGLAFIPWAPLSAGPLTEPAGLLAQIAAQNRATPGQVALAWLLRRSRVMLPIPGTSRVAHLEENVAAAGLQLADDEFAALSSAATGASS